MWFLYILLLAAIAYLGMRLYRIETEHPFQNPSAASSSIPRLSYTPSKASVKATGEAKKYCGYEKLLTNAEAALFGALHSALGQDFYLFSKVRMADVFEPVPQTPAARQSALNQICSRHLDFVVCRKGSWEIVAAVEMDEPGQKGAARPEGEVFVDEVFQQCGIPLMRLPHQSAYTVEEVVVLFETVMAGMRKPAPVPAAAKTIAVESKPAPEGTTRKAIPRPHQVLVPA